MVWNKFVYSHTLKAHKLLLNTSMPRVCIRGTESIMKGVRIIRVVSLNEGRSEGSSKCLTEEQKPLKGRRGGVIMEGRKVVSKITSDSIQKSSHMDQKKN